MDTLLIEITNQKAYQLLKQLEDLHILRVLKKESKNEVKLSEKYSGKLGLTHKEYSDFHQYIKESRN